MLKTVYTATRKENLALALDRRTGVYDKAKIATHSKYPDTIYVYVDVGGLQEAYVRLVQAVITDMLFEGKAAVILQGCVDETQIEPAENPLARKIGLRLQVTKIFEIAGPIPSDITNQCIDM